MDARASLPVQSAARSGLRPLWPQRVRCSLLGAARLQSATGDVPLERKTAACVAWLAIEPPTTRARLASLLWPEARADAARANLRQLTLRLRRVSGPGLLEGSDCMHIHPAASVDVRDLMHGATDHDWPSVAVMVPSLLTGMAFDDCPELAEWLELTRLQLARTVAHALGLYVPEVEREQGAVRAIGVVLRWLSLEPTSEAAYRQLMRLHAANQDRGAALAAFDACRTILRVQLDATPSEHTVALARRIRGAPLPGP